MIFWQRQNPEVFESQAEVKFCKIWGPSPARFPNDQFDLIWAERELAKLGLTLEDIES